MTDLSMLVKEGAKLLDQQEPQWFKEVDLEKLNMVKEEFCVLGQMYGDYYEGLKELFGGHGVQEEIRASNFGFVVSSDLYFAQGQHAYMELDELWREQIKTRLALSDQDTVTVTLTKAEMRMVQKLLTHRTADLGRIILETGDAHVAAALNGAIQETHALSYKFVTV